ncbi:mitochondrial ERMES protein Gem1 (MIRO mitochondrial rho GTPase) [Andalucia godoyi]|uniref:Mitochondrial ERMES protein Gem1 (MIRO mitochondrial rho GTPase) n=1 Tax=Andalucia godoyi TaxID=505711 RepID=A0A8K0AI11_ANDGO|nr:mitochondrial ERMES protein Gem1 (MIRO mitochondrial rho GTPase) [Andalucia godoyi]|eukprot:ANDGO_00736.mRNA.1 mitochondrial ERMES protein Gem1 (MIRO mitochondrial rho GTPase)
MSSSSGTGRSGLRPVSLDGSHILIALAGDTGAGKTSFCHALVDETPFSGEHFSQLSGPVVIPAALAGGYADLAILDSNADQADHFQTILSKSHVIVLMFDGSDPTDDYLATRRVSSYWLPLFKSLNLKVPVIIAKNKKDIPAENAALESVHAAMRNGELCANGLYLCELSVKDRQGIGLVVSYAQKSVLYPITPIFDFVNQTLTPHAARAFLRIFRCINRSCTGYLSDDELRQMQRRVFGSDFQPAELQLLKQSLKRAVAQTADSQDNGPSDDVSVAEDQSGVSFEGFLILMLRFVTQGASEAIWAFLRSFHYDDKLEIEINLPSLHHEPDQCVELSSEAVAFMTEANKQLFAVLLNTATGGLLFPSMDQPKTLEEEASSSSGQRAVPLDSVIAQYQSLALFDVATVARLFALSGYDSDDFGKLFKVSKRRALERRTNRVQRSVLQFYVFGSPNCGKSTLLKNGSAVRLQSKHTLVFREIPESYVDKVLQSREALDVPDVFVLAYDGADPYSFQYISQVYRKLVAIVPETPCVFVVTKADQDIVVQQNDESPEVFCKSRGLPWPPILTSALNDDFGSFFDSLLQVALRPQLCLPSVSQNAPGSAPCVSCPPSASNLRKIVLIGSSVVVVVGVAAYLYRRAKSN